MMTSEGLTAHLTNNYVGSMEMAFTNQFAMKINKHLGKHMM